MSAYVKRLSAFNKVHLTGVTFSISSPCQYGSYSKQAMANIGLKQKRPLIQLPILITEQCQ